MRNWIRTCGRALPGLVALGLALVARAAAAGDRLDAELAELVKLYTGTYLSAPGEGARDARPILMRVVPVTPPAGRRHALYSEMRHDGPQGDLYRQRLLVFDETPGRSANVMTALSFTDGAAAAGLIGDPGLVAAGTVATGPALAPGCDMRFRREGDGFLGRIEPSTCVITGKSGELRRIEGETLLRAQAIEQLERGYDADMKLLFGNPDGVRYVWPRR